MTVRMLSGSCYAAFVCTQNGHVTFFREHVHMLVLFITFKTQLVLGPSMTMQTDLQPCEQ